MAIYIQSRTRAVAFNGAHVLIRALVFCVFLLPITAWSADLPQTIETVKASVVGIGTYKKTRSPAISFDATGFVVDDGLSIITNAHAIPDVLDSENLETLGIVIGKGENVDFRPATLDRIDRQHDLALLKLTGAPLPALKLGDSNTVLEGQSFAFTGFPLGMVLGLHHATHRALLAAITPVVMPAMNSHKLDVKMIMQLQKSSFSIFQLDSTAYPGNSGSPLYDPATGTVYGVINMVLVRGLKETAISQPSGITYAIPSNFIRDFLQQKRDGEK
jgi:S1-C subfamily serine protease